MHRPCNTIWLTPPITDALGPILPNTADNLVTKLWNGLINYPRAASHYSQSILFSAIFWAISARQLCVIFVVELAHACSQILGQFCDFENGWVGGSGLDLGPCLHRRQQSVSYHSPAIPSLSSSSSYWLPQSWCIETEVHSGLSDSLTYTALKVSINQSMNQWINQTINQSIKSTDMLYISGWLKCNGGSFILHPTDIPLLILVEPQMFHLQKS